MRVVVVGATGNVGTAILRRLATEPSVDAVTGVARRLPAEAGDVAWHATDIGTRDAIADLTDVFAGAGAVIHLAWQIQPSHDRHRLRRTNVGGTAHVAEAAVRAAVPALVVASSVGAYAPGPKDRFVDEDWPVTGVPGSSYSQDKAQVEALLNRVEREEPQMRVVRMRPGLVFQSAAASEIARLFIGPFAPLGLLRFGRLPLVPADPRLRIQAVHATDAAEAYVRAAISDVRGPFNIAAEPVLDGPELARRFHGRTVPAPPDLLYAAARATWHARIQPTEPGWIRLAAACPLLSGARAERDLGWRARTDAVDAFAELIAGMARRAGDGSAPLRRRPPAPARLGAVLAGHLPGHGDPY